MATQTIQSTRGRTLDPSTLRGKTVVVFYEARDHVDDNLHLKESCGLLLERGTMGDRFDVLGVADVDGLSFVRPVVTAAIGVIAARYGAELWMDFDRALERGPWRLPGGGSTVAIVDARGEVVFCARGVLDAQALERFFDALGASLDHGVARQIARQRDEAAHV
ncbi:MAG: hypothetical protein H6719_05460 [Sandaracinaceae bacterium]|nr:hypothetical protein [Sandaracinaceae bacterium]